MSTCQQDSQILKIYTLIETSELYLACFHGKFFRLDEAVPDAFICKQEQIANSTFG